MTRQQGRATGPAMFTDSHCHLNCKGLVEDQAGVLAAPSPIFPLLDAPAEG